MKTNKQFRVLTVGWEPWFIKYLLTPIQERTDIEFIHGLVGESGRIVSAQKRYPKLTFVALSKKRGELLPDPDYDLLSKLECIGVPTVRSMIQGDRVLRNRSENESLGYATLLARRLKEQLKKYQPDMVLGSHDSLHAGMSLAVAKSLDIPWVALAFPVIPDNLTGFCSSLTPNSLVPISRHIDENMRCVARVLIRNVREKTQNVAAVRPPWSLSQWVKQYINNSKNYMRRNRDSRIYGVDRFTYPTDSERILDILKRSYNRLCLPTDRMLRTPPAERFVYYPLQMSPESTVDVWAPFYQDQLAFITQLSLAIPIDTTLVVKLHFGDPDSYSRQQLQKLMSMPRLRIAHPMAAGNEFIEKAALVIGITGTSCLEAALHGKPTLIFGDSPYVHFPRSERAKSPDKLFAQIGLMLQQTPPSDEEIVESYVTYMARYLPGRVNDWSLPIKSIDIERWGECFNALRKYLGEPINEARWYSLPPFCRPDTCHQDIIDMPARRV